MDHQQFNIWAIIPAAGIGKRMGASVPKQYLSLAGKTVLEHSISRILECDLVSGVAVGIAKSDSHWGKIKIQHPKFLGHFQGGEERIHTVINGINYLQKMAQKHDRVLVHDAVRPCISLADIQQLIRFGLKSKSGAILACNVVDTVKKISRHNRIIKTLDRTKLVLAQTPQLFPFAILEQALHQALKNNQLGTDESAVVEALGLQPIIITGRRTNIKITTPEDLALARVIRQLNLDLSTE